MMRMLAWWGTTSAMSSAVTPACVIDFSAESTMMRTARRKTSLPSIWMYPPRSAVRAAIGSEPSASRSQPSSWPGPSTASSTTAPDAVGEQDGGAAVVPVGDARQRVGADHEHLARRPMAISPWAATSP